MLIEDREREREKSRALTKNCEGREKNKEKVF